jgi:hypothetical protein
MPARGIAENKVSEDRGKPRLTGSTLLSHTLGMYGSSASDEVVKTGDQFR